MQSMKLVLGTTVLYVVVEQLPDITDNRLVFDYFEPNRTQLILVK